MPLRPFIWGCASLATMLCGGVALAHTAERGFILLLPTEYYLLGGTLSVAVSFAILIAISPHRIVEQARRRLVLSWNPPKYLDDILALGAFILFAFLIYCGVEGTRDPLTNPLPQAVWTLGWVGVTILHAVVGNFWAFLNPWRFPVRLIRRAAGLPVDGAGWLTLPTSLAGWPAIVFFMGIAWFELVDLAPDDPDRLAIAVGSYWLVHFIGSLLFGEKRWLHAAEPLTILFRYLSLIAPVGFERVGTGRRMTLAWPGARAFSADPPPIAVALFLLLTLATVSFDGLNMTFWWLGLNGINPLEFPGRSVVTGINTAGLAGAWIVLALLYGAAIWLGQKLGRADFQSAFRLFVLSILPISLAYHLSHYLTVLLVNGQWALVAANDPLGTGADLFGLRDFRVTTSFLNVAEDVERLWQIQVAIIVLGHILAVILAHGLSSRIGYTHSRFQTLSQIPLALLMIVYTLFGLWLLSSPTGG